jgi:hypothetical protein
MFSTKIRTTVAALAAAATLMTLGVAAAPADAVAAAPADAAIGSLTAQLSMSRSGSYLYNVNVSGTVPMTQAEARSLIGSGHKVVYRLWGDDPVSDDFLWGPVDTELVSTPLGLQFTGLGLTRTTTSPITATRSTRTCDWSTPEAQQFGPARPIGWAATSRAASHPTAQIHLESPRRRGALCFSPGTASRGIPTE